MARQHRTGKSPYQKYGKTPYRYSDLSGIAFQRMLIQRFGSNYWIKIGADGKPLLNEFGSSIRTFPHEAYVPTGQLRTA